MSVLEDNEAGVTASLEEWARNWELGKSWLVCRHCKGLQSFRGGSSQLPFRAHLAQCPALNRREQFPLFELRAALDALRPVTP